MRSKLALLVLCLACSTPSDTEILTAWPFDQRTGGDSARVLHTFTFQPDGNGIHRQIGAGPSVLMLFRWTLTGSRLCMTYSGLPEECGRVRVRMRDGNGEIEWLKSGKRWVSRYRVEKP